MSWLSLSSKQNQYDWREHGGDEKQSLRMETESRQPTSLYQSLVNASVSSRPQYDAINRYWDSASSSSDGFYVPGTGGGGGVSGGGGGGMEMIDLPPVSKSQNSASYRPRDQQQSSTPRPREQRPSEPVNRKRPAPSSIQSLGFKRSTWDGTILYRDRMPFMLRHILEWRIPAHENIESDLKEDLRMSVSRYHTEFCICLEHGKIWQAYGGLGIGNADSLMFTPAHACMTCQDDSLYTTYINAVAEEVRNGKGRITDLRKAWIEKRGRLFSLRNSTQYKRDKESGQEDTTVGLARSAMQKAFFVYTLQMWEIAEEYRRWCIENPGSTDTESESKAQDLFTEYVMDFAQYKESMNTNNNIPRMLCTKHGAIGEAVPWRRKGDYKECMICKSKEDETDGTQRRVAVGENRPRIPESDIDRIFADAEKHTGAVDLKTLPVKYRK